ncbi:MAG: methyl-accepting chemotaxis protein [Bacillota bacterium]
MKNSLQLKLTYFTVILISVIVLIFTVVVINRQTEILTDSITAKGKSIASALTGVAENNIQHESYYTLTNGFEAVMSANKDVRYLMLTDKYGKVYVHTDSKFINQVLKDNLSDKINKSMDPLVNPYVSEKGEEIYDIAVPVTADLERWGALRVGISSSTVKKEVADARNLLISIAVILLAAGGVLSIVIARIIVSPLRQLATKVALVADGDLTQEVTVKTKDEIGFLADSVNKMVASLRNIVGDIVNAGTQLAGAGEQLSTAADRGVSLTQQVAAAIEEVAKGNHNQTENVTDAAKTMEQFSAAITAISRGAQEQADYVHRASRIIDNMVRSIQEMAEGTHTISESAEHTSIAAREGGEAVQSTITGMNRIQEKVTETAEKVKELGGYSEKIGEIIAVIDDIAGQTNLLALNAAIEAARAGEHGRGFAVVADEVRKLAERSSSATKEIAELITSIQSVTGRAVTAMEEGIREVDNGVGLSENAGRALGVILDNIKNAGAHMEGMITRTEELAKNSSAVVEAMNSVAAVTEENTAATEEMAAGSEHVSASIQNIAAISEETSASSQEVAASTREITGTTEEIAGAAHRLAELAEKLQKLTGKFRL